MGRASTPSFVLAVKLDTEHDSALAALCRAKENTGRTLYNLTLGIALKNYHKLQADPRFRRLLNEKRDAAKDSPKYKELTAELGGLETKYGLTEYDLQTLARVQGRIYQNNLCSKECEAIGARVFHTIRRLRFGDARRVRFRSARYPFTVPHKTNKCGLHIKAHTRELLFGRRSFPLPVPVQDEYLNYCLDHCKVKYCMLVSKTKGGSRRYYLYIVFAGPKPLSPGQQKVQERIKALEQETGLPYKDIRVGLDAGISTLAAVNPQQAMLCDLIDPSLEKQLQKIRTLQQALDRSRRANNPDNYNADGTAKPRKEQKPWVKSKRCLKLEYKLIKLQQHAALKRREHQRSLALQTVSMGGKIFVEDMKFKALAKRSTKETELNPETGKCRRKKRFGSSVFKAAPGQLLRFIKELAPLYGGQVYTVNSITHRASQYLPDKGVYEKHPLYQRAIMVQGEPVQRDILSAFNLFCTAEGLKAINARLSAEQLPHFLLHHAAEMERLQSLPEKELGRHLSWYLRGVVTALHSRRFGTAPQMAVSPERDRRLDLKESAESCGLSPSGPTAAAGG